MTDLKLRALLLPLMCGAVIAPALAQGSGDMGGPAVAGVCLLSRDAVFASSKVGQAGFARFQQLEREATAELDAKRGPLDEEIALLRNSASTLNPAERATREAALNARLAPLQARSAHLRRELDATRTKLLERITSEMTPLVAAAYQQKKCGLLLDRASVIGGNMANDLTADVTTALDAKIQTISFNREMLPSNAVPDVPQP